MVRCLIMFTKKNNIQYLILRDTQLPRYFKRVILIRQKNYRCYGHRLPTSLTLLMILVVPCWRNKTPCKVRHFGNQTGKAWKLKFLDDETQKYKWIRHDTTHPHVSGKKKNKQKYTSSYISPCLFWGGSIPSFNLVFSTLGITDSALVDPFFNKRLRSGGKSIRGSSWDARSWINAL